jgi:hypothetical protein
MNSSRSVATRPPFSWWGRCGLWRGTWWSGLQRALSWPLCVVAALLKAHKGRSLRSSSKSFMALSSSFGADPGLFLEASDSPRLALLTYRLTEERLTEKVRAAWTLDMVDTPGQSHDLDQRQ